MSDRLNIENELNELASRLPVRAPRTPYSVPMGYFEGLVGQVLDRIHREQAQEELQSISPLLSQLTKQTPYATPTGYFEKEAVLSTKKPGRIVSIASSRWVRYAAAAVITGAIFLLMPGQNDPTPPATVNTVITEYQKDIQQLDETQQARLSEFVEAGMTGQETAQTNNARSLQSNLLADVSEQEISEFFEQSEYITSTSTNE